MRYKLLLTINLLLIILCGCTENQEKDFAYQINSTYTFKCNEYDITHELFIEKNESRFVWNYVGPSDEFDIFYFIFQFENLELDNSDEFDYFTSAGNEIKFDYIDSTKLNKYQFSGPITIYIYYNNASSEIKDIINNNTYNLEISSVKWFSKPELFS